MVAGIFCKCTKLGVFILSVNVVFLDYIIQQFLEPTERLAVLKAVAFPDQTHSFMFCSFFVKSG
jgi:hypothetical protein